jgi:hypothetical protein
MPALAPILNESDFEIALLCYWLKRVADLDDVTVIVRRYGKVVRTICVSPDDDPTARNVSFVQPCPVPAE